jgi:hypothetical protein
MGRSSIAYFTQNAVQTKPALWLGTLLFSGLQAVPFIA